MWYRLNRSVPKNREKRRVTILMLIICPNTRIEAANPDACPYWLRLTELMMVFMLGEENRAKPSPTQMRIATMIQMGVLLPKKASIPNPEEQMAIPAVKRSNVAESYHLAFHHRREYSHHNWLCHDDSTALRGESPCIFANRD